MTDKFLYNGVEVRNKVSLESGSSVNEAKPVSRNLSRLDNINKVVTYADVVRGKEGG